MKVVAGFLIVTICIFVSCSRPTIETVPEVIPERFMGTWYEIASLPTTYNKGCACSKIDMEMAPDNNYIRMINSCMKKDKQGAVLAKAFIQKGSGNAKMRVQLFWPFRSDFYVVSLATDYSYTMVCNPNKTSLQILSRQKFLNDSIYNELIIKADSLGFATSAMIRTTQNCN